MSFVDELRTRNNPMSGGGIGGGGAYFGDPGRGGMNDGEDISGALNQAMPFFHQIRNRNLEDFKAKEAFSSDLALRQDRLRALFNPQGGTGGAPQNVVYQPPESEQNKITPFQQAGLNLERQKFDESRRTGEEKLGLDRAKFGLDQQKNAQIFETKIADMQRQAEEADKKLQLAQQIANTRAGDADAQRALQSAALEATNARHALDLAQKDAEHNETKRQFDEKQKLLNKQLEEQGLEVSEVTLPDGTKQSKVTRKGSKTYRVIAPDGTHGNWPSDTPLAKGYTKIQ